VEKDSIRSTDQYTRLGTTSAFRIKTGCNCSGAHLGTVQEVVDGQRERFLPRK